MELIKVNQPKLINADLLKRKEVSDWFVYYTDPTNLSASKFGCRPCSLRRDLYLSRVETQLATPGG